MKRLLTGILVLVCPLYSQAQVSFGPVYEEVISSRVLDYEAMPMAEHGVLLLQQQMETKGTHPLTLKLLDIDLNLRWKKTLNLEEPLGKYYQYADGFVHLLLDKPAPDTWQLLRIDTQTGEVMTYEAFELADFELSNYQVIENTLILSGIYQERPAVFTYNYQYDGLNALPNVFQDEAELSEIKVNNDGLTFNVLVSVLDEKNDRTLSVNTYDHEGNAIRNYTLEVKPNYQLKSGQVSSINDIAQTVIGTYTVDQREGISGIYVNHIDRTGRQSMTYHNLSELPYFLDFMNKRKAEELKQRAALMKRTGKEKKYRFSLYPRRMEERDGKLITTWSCFERQAFKSHIYTLVLDEQGHLEWGEMMTSNETEGLWVAWRSKYQWLKSGKAARIAYHQKKLYTKLLDGSGKNIAQTATLPLSTDRDELRFEESGKQRVVVWGEQHFMVYGLKHVRPKDKSQRVRHVFYINKLSVEDY